MKNKIGFMSSACNVTQTQLTIGICKTQLEQLRTITTERIEAPRTRFYK